MRSNKGFPETLFKLLEDRELSQRELIRRTRERDGWGSPQSISLLLKGEMRPTIKAMEAIAGALVVSPETFAEYRLAIARNELDPDSVGLKKALTNLQRIMGGAVDGADPVPHSPKKHRGRRRAAGAGRDGSA